MVCKLKYQADENIKGLFYGIEHAEMERLSCKNINLDIRFNDKQYC